MAYGRKRTHLPPKIIRMVTVPCSFKLLLPGQMRYMREKGFNILMLSSDGPERNEVIKLEGCSHKIIPVTRTASPLRDVRCIIMLAFFFRKEKPDIVHTHTPKAGLLGMIASWIAGVPTRIHTVAGLNFLTVKGWRRFLLVQAEKTTYFFAHKIWANSQSLRDYIIRHQLAKTEKVDLIGHGSSNGIDLTRYSRSVLKQDILKSCQKEINYKENNCYLLAVGRMVRDKGIADLIKAFTTLHPTLPQLRLILIGPYEAFRKEEILPKEIKDIIENHPAITHITFSDKVEYFMSFCDLFIHCSYREGFPSVLLQAGAMQCPILCSKIIGNVDLVKNGVTGLCFPQGDINTLCEKIVYALNNKGEILKMAETLRNDIEQKYDQKEFHQELLRRYQSLF